MLFWNFIVALFAITTGLCFYVVSCDRAEGRPLPWRMLTVWVITSLTVMVLVYIAWLADGWDWVVRGFLPGLLVATIVFIIIGAIVEVFLRMIEHTRLGKFIEWLTS